MLTISDAEAIFCFGKGLRHHGNAAQFPVRLELRDFGRAQTLEFFPLAHIGMAHVAKDAELINDLTRQINGAHTLHAVRRRIARSSNCSALRAFFEELLPWPVVLRPAFDSAFLLLSVIFFYFLRPRIH